MTEQPHWFNPPGEFDFTAFATIALLIAALYGLVYLYAAFDRWAEERSVGTPLAKTIPTLLAIALLYEVFPLDHFHILIPMSVILLALVTDWSRHKQLPKTPQEPTEAVISTDDIVE